jgi:hypothetical protein
MTELLTILHGISTYAVFLERGLAIFGSHIGRHRGISLPGGPPTAPRSDEARHAS